MLPLKIKRIAQKVSVLDACPAGARVFGDLDDPNSVISKKMKSGQVWRLKEDKGTSPKVFYMGQYSPRG